MFSYSGFEHSSVNATPDCTAGEIAEWFKSMFDFEIHPSNSSIMIKGRYFGWLEIVRVPSAEQSSGHHAIRVEPHLFEFSVAELEAKGVEFKTIAKTEPGKPKVACITNAPAGIKIHLVCRQP